MKVSLQKALSLYLTGSTNPCSLSFCDTKNCPYTEDELAEMGTSLKEREDSNENSYKFKNPTLALNADYDSFTGYMRNAGLGVFDSLSTGIGSGFASKIDFKSGVALASLSVLGSIASRFKNLPVLTTNFSLFDVGARLIRAPLHFFDSTFSQVGEKGADFTLPSTIAGALSLFSLDRVLKDKDNKTLEVPNTTISGTVGRTALHHLESMLASKGTQISTNHESTSAFLAGSALTSGLLLPDSIKNKDLPYQTFEGLIAQGGTHFLDSLFANIGNSFSKVLLNFGNSQNALIGSLGLLLGLPLLGTIPKIQNHEASFSKLGGRLIRSLLHAPETLVFNLGNSLGKSILGIPLSLGFLGLTYLGCISKSCKNILKNFKIPMNTIGGQLQRLPFDFIYSLISASGIKLSQFIPSPILVLIGPALSFQIGERFKNIDAKYNELKGLMVRNTAHLWETILSNAAYRTGRLLTRTQDDRSSSGSVLSDGRWLTSEGQIVPTMAIGKQMNHGEEKNIKSMLLSGLGGIAFGFGAFMFSKHLMKGKVNEEKQIESQVHKVIGNGNVEHDTERLIIKPTIYENPVGVYRGKPAKQAA